MSHINNIHQYYNHNSIQNHLQGSIHHRNEHRFNSSNSNCSVHGNEPRTSTLISLPSFSLLLFAPPPYPLNPPSYCTVLRAGERTCPVPSLMDYLLGPSAPFIAPTPPPTYNEAVGIHEVNVENFIDIPVINPSFLGGDPIQVVCPQCIQLIETETRTFNTKLTHITALMLCIIGCWPCFFLPYCFTYFKKTLHYCPICGYYFGFYSPLSAQENMTYSQFIG